MLTPDASLSGTFSVGGDISVHRLGFGAMRITGKGIWGEPENRGEALAVLRKLPELGVNFIDTADSYGPFVSEELICEALHPYPGLLVATKGGLVRHGPNVWAQVGRPEYLRQCVLMSLRRLKLERIDLWQLHRIDAKVPADEQFGAIADMQREGLIRHAGLSEVSVDEIQKAQRFFKVATVQNRFNLTDRGSEQVLNHCTENKIGFIPWYPLAAGDLARPESILNRLAKSYGATPGQIALAWILKKSPVMLPIPGTSKFAHLEENVAAASLKLSDADAEALEAEGSPG